jgi:molybdate transport system substrate-binding protein
MPDANMPRPIKLLSSMAPREVLAAAIELYGARATIGIEAHAAGGVDVARRVAAGEEVDIVVLANDAIELLIGGGHLVAEGRVDLMQSSIALAVRAGAPRPAILDTAGVREAVKNAATIGYSTGPSGKYLEKLFERWEILEELRPRIVIPPPGTPVAKLVAAGDVALGFQQMSELLNMPGIEVVGPLPEEIQSLTTFTAAISRTCSDRARVGQFLSFLVSSQMHEIMRRHGMAAVH